MNKRNSPTLEHALAAITDCIKLDTGCVRKVFTQSGTPVTALNQFFEEEDVFFAYGNERYHSCYLPSVFMTNKQRIVDEVLGVIQVNLFQSKPGRLRTRI